MLKRENVLSTTVILIGVAIAIMAAFVYWGGRFTQEITEEVESDEDVAESVENSKIKISEVNIDPLHESDMYVTIENKGMLVVEKVRVKVYTDGDVYSDTFPKDIEYESGLLDLKFFEVKTFTVYFDGGKDLSEYTKIEVIPTVRLEDGSLKLILEGMESHIRG